MGEASNAAAPRPARNPRGPGGYRPWPRHSSLMYPDTHRSSLLARDDIRRGRAHARVDRGFLVPRIEQAAFLDHPGDVLQERDVGQRIARDRDQVREPPGRDGA